MKEREILETLDRIMQFLARRDVTQSEIFQQKYDLGIVLGSSFYESAELGAKLLEKGKLKTLMLSGGVGHSTHYLEERLFRDKKVSKVSEYSESEYLYNLIADYDQGNIFLECESKNCGENAAFSIDRIEKLVSESKIDMPKRVLLLQDPALQRRTHATFEHVWKNFPCEFISFSPLIPKFDIERKFESYFSFERALDLLLGEILRLQDSEIGYGPKGKGFIIHVDIPSEIQEAYDILVERFPKYKEWKQRGEI